MKTNYLTPRQMAKAKRNKEIAEHYRKLRNEMPTAPNRVLFDEKNWKGYDLCSVQITRILKEEGVYDAGRKTNCDVA